MKKYYIVIAKCGHVGRGNYIDVPFPVIAESASEAAQKALKFGRVKKQLKNAISSVNEVDEKEFYDCKHNSEFDSYLNAHCKRESKLSLSMIKELDFDFDKKDNEYMIRKERISYKLKKFKILMEGLKNEFVY